MNLDLKGKAVLVTGGVMAALALVGSIETTWTVSAATVLIYYGVANLCALRQPRDQRRIPRAIPALGLVLCLVLAIFIVLR